MDMFDHTAEDAVAGVESVSRDASYEEFSTAFREAIGIDCVPTSSCTASILAALLACDVGPGDEVAVPALTFYASAEPIRLLGATPVYVDVKREDGTMCPKALSAALTDNTKAVVAVHYAGNPCDMEGILDATRWSIPVIEDCAQALGATIDGRPVGSFGSYGCFSFHVDKMCGSQSDLGCITAASEYAQDADDPDANFRLDFARMIINHGQLPGEIYNHVFKGFNGRASALECAQVTKKLRMFDDIKSRRIEAERLWIDSLVDNHMTNELRVVGPSTPGAKKSPNRLVFAADDRETMLKVFETIGVPIGIHYPDILPALNAEPDNKKVDRGRWPAARRLTETAFTVPTHLGITAEEVERAAKAVAFMYNDYDSPENDLTGWDVPY